MVNNHSSSRVESLVYLETAILLVASVAMMFIFSTQVLALVTGGFLILSAIMLMIFDYQESDARWMTCGFAILSGLIIGTVQLDLLISLAVLVAMVLRMSKVEFNMRAKLLLIMLVSVLVGFAVSSFFDFIEPSRIETLTFFTDGLVIQYVLVAVTTLAVLFKELNTFGIRYEELLDEQEVLENRIREQTKTTNSLTRYIPDQIWQPIIKDNTPANLFNKRAKLTIIFSDIVGFTELSEIVSADVLTEILNTYMDRMTVVAKRHDVILDKFIGDGMMCFFGAHGHKSPKDNALKAVEFALDMRRETRVLRKQWQKEGFTGLSVRIGINTGFCHVGNFGTDLRMSYTALGKEVNLASRLESVAKADEIFISQSTYDYIGFEYNCEIVGNVKLKGFESTVACYRVLEPVTSEQKTAQWIDYDLPGFNLHLNFRDIKNYDFEQIRQKLEKAIERVDYIQQTEIEKIEQTR